MNEKENKAVNILEELFNSVLRDNESHSYIEQIESLRKVAKKQKESENYLENYLDSLNDLSLKELKEELLFFELERKKQIYNTLNFSKKENTRTNLFDFVCSNLKFLIALKELEEENE